MADSRLYHLVNLPRNPMQNSAKLKGKDSLEQYSSHSYYKKAEIHSKSFINMNKNYENEIVNVLDTIRKLHISENKAILVPIIKTVILHVREKNHVKNIMRTGTFLI